MLTSKCKKDKKFCQKKVKKIPNGTWSAGNATSGCVKKHGRESICKGGEEFVKVENVKLLDSSFARVDEKLSLKECEQKCLENCSCTAYGGVDVKEEV